MVNWSRPIGQDSCTAKAKTKADWLLKSEISEPDFNGANKKKEKPCKKFATLRLFVKTMLIFKAGRNSKRK
jgi:hypothetical protein